MAQSKLERSRNSMEDFIGRLLIFESITHWERYSNLQKRERNCEVVSRLFGARNCPMSCCYVRWNICKNCGILKSPETLWPRETRFVLGYSETIIHCIVLYSSVFKKWPYTLTLNTVTCDNALQCSTYSKYELHVLHKKCGFEKEPPFRKSRMMLNFDSVKVISPI